MTEPTEAWPFVVSRNPTLDWRPVLAPPFLLDARADYLLVHETAGDGGPFGSPKVKRIDSGLGRLTLAYRRRDAEAELIGDFSDPQGDQQLHDRFGRPIYVVEGVVLRGDRDIPRGQLDGLLDAVRAQTASAFPAFWHLAEESVPPLPSMPMMVPARPRGRFPRDLLLAGLAGALAFLALKGRGSARGNGTDQGTSSSDAGGAGSQGT